MTTTKITVETLEAAGACEDGIERFRRAFPDGLDYDPTSHECAARILSSECAEDVAWAVKSGVIEPMRLTAGRHGSATAGNHGSASAGYFGSATAGYFGSATAGNYGSASAGNYGSASAGVRGSATAGYRGSASAGHRGTLCIRYFDGDWYRLAVAYVGEHAPGLREGEVIEAGVAYRVTNSGEWRRA